MHIAHFTCSIAAKEKRKDGSTACTVLLYNDEMYVANIGDSGAVLASRDKGMA